MDSRLPVSPHLVTGRRYATDRIVKFNIRFGIRSLMLVVMIFALGFAFLLPLLPFDPKIAIEQATMSSSRDSNGVLRHRLAFTVRNEGRFSVWFVGFADGSAQAVILHQEGARAPDHFVYFPDDERFVLKRIPPQAEVTVHIPVDIPIGDDVPSCLVIMEFRDWRGYTEIRESSWLEPDRIDEHELSTLNQRLPSRVSNESNAACLALVPRFVGSRRLSCCTP